MIDKATVQRIKAACGRALAGVLLLVTVLAGGAGEARAVTLASNVGQSIAFHSTSTHYEIDVSENYIARAQTFRTGSNVAGYTLSSVEVYVFDVQEMTVVKMRICAADLAGAPDRDTCPYTLTNPVPYNQAGYDNNDYGDEYLNIFTAPDNATLSPNTDYFVVFENDGTQATEPDTYSDYWLGYVLGGSEDSGGAAGWSIGDNHYSWFAGHTSWRMSSVNPFRIRFNGAVNIDADTIPPSLNAATVDGSFLELTYNEALDTGSRPATNAYLVSVDGSSAAPSSVAVSGTTVTLTLGTAVMAGQTVTVTYTVPSSNPVQDAADPGNSAPSFSSQRVENITAEPPGPPTGLTATAAIAGNITLNWAVPGYDGGSAITGYKIEVRYYKGDNFEDLVRDTVNTATTYTHMAPDPGRTYIYRVSAINVVGTGEASNVATATAQTGDNKPSAPRTLRGSAKGKMQINLSWDPPGYPGVPAFTGYKIEMCIVDGKICAADDGTNWVDVVDNTGNTATNYKHTGLDPGTTYAYRVSAINMVGTSTHNLEPNDLSFNARTESEVPLSGPNLSAVPGDQQVTLQWRPHDSWREPPPNGIDGVAIFTGYAWQKQRKVDNGITEAADDAWMFPGGNPNCNPCLQTYRELTNGQTYTFFVRAVFAFKAEHGAQGVYSVPAQIEVTPGPPRIEGVAVKSAPQSDDTYGRGETIVFTLTFSQKVRVTGQPQPTLAFDLGGSTREARYTGITDTDVDSDPRPRPRPEGVKVHFAYTVKSGDRDTDGIQVGELASAITLGGARIQRAAVRVDADGHKVDGVDAVLAHAALGQLRDHKVDGGTARPPAGSGITIIDTHGNPLTDNRLTLRESTRGRYGLKLNTRPTHTVRVAAIASDGDPDLQVLPTAEATKAITPDEWETPFYLDLRAAIDNDDEIGERVFLNRSFSQDPAYHDLILPDVTVVEDERADDAGALSVADAEATEGVDDTLDFVVKLDRKPSRDWEVTVDYRTQNGTATAGFDYTLTSGTLTFAPGEDKKTVSVPIVDDAMEDNGETFTLVLSNASAAGFASNGTQAVGTIRNTETPARPDLTASFEGLPESHDGEDTFHFRVAFSEEIGIGFRTMRDESFTVDGGEVTGARRVDGRHDLWRITVAPDSDEAMTITLPGGRACGVSGAICTRGGDRRQLTNTPTATVAGPPVVPLTADFVQKPYEHDGETAFTLRIAFSEGIAIGFRTFRDQSVSATGGGVTKAKRVDRRKDLWEITVEPDTNEAVTLTLAGGRACGTAGAVCTSDGRALSAALSTTVLGPAALTVADARAKEGTDETIDFTVSLSRATRAAVTVAYATADGTATAGSDYTATSGTLTFAAGETEQTVLVPVLDDAHDEGEETLTLRLTNATGAVIADGEATGTIKNTDHMPQAWLARFGRTAATHVTDAVGERLRDGSGASHVTVGGYRLPLEKRATDGADDGVSGVERLVLALGQRLGLGTGTAPAGAGGVAGAGGWPDAPVATDPRLGQSRTLDVGNAVNLRQVLLGSSFRLAFGRDDVGSGWPRLTAWGRVAGTTFDGRDGDLTLNGDVLTGTVGVDGEWDRLLAGLAVAHSRGDGSFTKPGTADRGRGELETTLTSIHPYLRYAVNDRLDMWGVLGYGTGQMEMELDTGETRETDMDLVMGAFGGRGILLPAGETGGFELATRTDAMLTRTSSDAVAGMASADAEAHRLRLVLEGSRGFAWAEGRRLTPTMEVGLRHDWGDAETGFGLELGGRVRYADPALGLTIDAAVRGLLAHEDDDYQEWGASGSLRLAPGAGGQGLALTLAPTWGATASGVNGLWSRQTTAGLAPQGGTQAQAGRLNAQVGYGLWLPSTGGLVTPFTGVSVTDGDGWRTRAGLVFDRPATWGGGLRVELAGESNATAVGQSEQTIGFQLQFTFGSGRRVAQGDNGRGRAQGNNGRGAKARSTPVPSPTTPDGVVTGPRTPTPTRADKGRHRAAVRHHATAQSPAWLQKTPPVSALDRAGGRRYFVQLGTFSDHADAIKARTELAVDLSDILRHDNRPLTIVASKKGGLLRVVFAQAFPTPKAAAALCVGLQARGLDCSVTRARPLPDKASRGLHVAKLRGGR